MSSCAGRPCARLLVFRLVIPRAGEVCFVPHGVWPHRTAASTPHGAGWIASVVAVDACSVRLRREGVLPGEAADDGAVDVAAADPAAATGVDGVARRVTRRRGAHADDTLARRTFAVRCVLVAGAPMQGAWRTLDDDALDGVLSACDLSALLALEATHRGALLAVRGFLQRHCWAHTTVARSAALAEHAPAPCVAAAVASGLVAMGACDAAGGACLHVWHDAEPIRRHRSAHPVTVVTLDAATGAVAWSSATATRRGPLFVLEAADGDVHAYRPCFATALAWTERGTLLVGERGRLVEWRPGHLERTLLTHGPGNAATALAASESRALVGWDDGAVHAVHSPPAPLLRACPCHGAYELRAPCDGPTAAVALAKRSAAAAVGFCVDVWTDASAHRLCVGASVTALCLQSSWLLVGAGAEGRVEVWQARDGRRVGALAGAGGTVASLATADECIVRCSATTNGGAVVLRSRAPMRLA